MDGSLYNIHSNHISKLYPLPTPRGAQGIMSAESVEAWDKLGSQAGDLASSRVDKWVFTQEVAPVDLFYLDNELIFDVRVPRSARSADCTGFGG